MKVTLIDYTDNAVDKLIFCKNTRLQMLASSLDSIRSWSAERKQAELEYMADTIKSSWEFVDYTFSIEGVSRAFTHQIVRNRQGSYAQQTMRILDVSGFDYVVGPSIQADQDLLEKYCDMMETINATYEELISAGASIEDARGILPTNIKTNIVAKYNLRTLSDIFNARRSPRTQGEFRDVVEAMYDEVLKVHPFAYVFLKDKKAEAAQRLYSIIQSDYEGTNMYIPYIKVIDQLVGK